jgi:hypothetical protein
MISKIETLPLVSSPVRRNRMPKPPMWNDSSDALIAFPVAMTPPGAVNGLRFDQLKKPLNEVWVSDLVPQH